MSAQQSLSYVSNSGAFAAPENIQLADAQLSYFSRFYAPAESAALLQHLLAETPWRQDTINFGGKPVLIPRLQAWYGDRRYGYSGLRFPPLPWTPVMESICHRISMATGLRFNSALVNYYRDGNDSVAWHSDDESELGPDPLIASLSLGATRRFELKRKATKRTKMNLLLEDGSLLLMGSGLQRHWQHQLPKDEGVVTPRINLTFRLIL